MSAEYKRQIASAEAIGVLKAFTKIMQSGEKLNMELHVELMQKIVEKYESASLDIRKELSERAAA